MSKRADRSGKSRARRKAAARSVTTGGDAGTGRELTRGDWADAGYALLLTAICLAGWAATLIGPAWWIAGLAAAAIGCLAAITVASIGAGTPVTALVLLVLYLLAAGPIAAERIALRGLGFLEDGIGGTGRAWGLLLGTYPPITAEGDVLLVPVLLSLASAGMATALALGGTRAWAPLAPPTLLLVLTLLLAERPPLSLVVQGAAFAVTAIAWAFVRGQRLDRPTYGGRAVDSGAGRRLVTGLALVLGVTGATTVLMAPGTAADEQRVQLRDQVSGYDASAVTTPLDDFRVFTRQPNADLLEVFGLPTGTRMRFSALDTYDGTTWSAGNETDPTTAADRFLRLSDSIDVAPVPEGEVERTASVRVSGRWERPWVPLTGQVTGFEFTRDGGAERRTLLRFNPASGTALMQDVLTAEDDYRFTTVLGDDTLTRAMSPSPHLDEANYEQAAFLDEAVAAWSIGATSAVDALLRIGSKLRSVGRYTDGAEGWESDFTAGHDRQRLGREFVLGVPTAGNDEQYAAAMALFASRLRIPARVVVGAVLPKSGVIKGKDVSAWVEVRVADGTWRTLPSEAFVATKALERTDTEAGSKPVRRTFPDPETLPSGEQQPPAYTPTAPPPETPETAESSADSGGPGWWIWLVPLVLLLAAVPAAKALRRRRRRQAESLSARYAGAWDELVDSARDLGYDVPVGVTRQAQAQALAEPALVADPPRTVALAWRADEAIFGGQVPAPGEAEEFWTLVDEQRATLAESRPLWRRLLAQLNPTSLTRHL